MQTTSRDILQSVFGYSHFRGAQEEIIEEVVAGRDALVLMPTGGGKSLCYQIPAILRPGLGIIISPLIALMQDQVNTLLQLGVRAAHLNSSHSPEDAFAVRKQIKSGELDILYVSPERMVLDSFLTLLSDVEIGLFAIDEAHCVSNWGHDFRPEYMGLSILKELFPDIPRIAVTATADGPTRREIIRALSLETAKVFVSGFDRPNISYHVALKNRLKKQLIDFIKSEHSDDAGIVYCLSRKKVEDVARYLQEEGLDAIPYHAGLSNQVRAKNQERFINEEGVIVVATIAFGMGIDKPNVRFVAHVDLPKSVEGYYQETGRAGRDSLPATAWMAYSLGDVVTRRQMIASSDSSDERKRIEQQKLTALLGYAETTSCRRAVLLNYFGEAHQGSCGNCDTCLHPVDTWDGTIAAQQALSAEYRTGQRFGVSYLTDILLGKENERIQRFGHDGLSTFGVGTDLSATEWSSVFRQLVAAGIVAVDIEGYGGLHLTELSGPVLKGEQQLLFRKDIAVSKKKRSEKSKADIVLREDAKPTFEALRKKRLELAKEQSVPPYVIFHDKTLIEMAEVHPTTMEQFSTISGVGERKLEKYGEIFLTVLEASLE